MPTTTYITFDTNYDPRDERANKQEHASLSAAKQHIIDDNDEHPIAVFTRHPSNPGQLVRVDPQALIDAPVIIPGS